MATNKKVSPKKNYTKGTAKKNSAVSQNQKAVIILFAVGILLVAFALIDGQHIWAFFRSFLFGIFGFATYFVGIFIMITASFLAKDGTDGTLKVKIWEVGILFWLICAEIQIFTIKSSEVVSIGEGIGRAYLDGTIGVGGGLFGALIGVPLTYALGKFAAIVVIGIAIFILVFFVTGATLIGFLESLTKPVKKFESKAKEYYNERNKIEKPRFNVDVQIDDLPSHPVSSRRFCVPDLEAPKPKKSRKEKQLDDENKMSDTKNEPAQKLDELVEKAAILETSIENDIRESKSNDSRNIQDKNSYRTPPLQLLKNVAGRSNKDISGELRSNADKLVNTLLSFGVEARIINICRGPSVTRYELQPSAGVKISKITNLADDIALGLAAGGVRIEAPIPNKPAVGIEVPNKQKDMVTLREVVESSEFRDAKSPLTFSLGKDIAGNIAITDIAKAPHLLIAGATGSGKSVCINSLIISLLYKSSPDDVRLLMIDPKVVELGVYNGIPHLLVPVVTDPRKAAGALGWAVTEMLNRYKMFAQTGVRDLSGFNNMAKSGRLNENGEPFSPMPKIVIIIDELADLMMAASKEVEDSICRLAQMARAAGMHLIIATQRPSVDVITGVIKANIPSRIAFTVSSQVDSRTILDGGGAEKLLGKGDMLFNPIDKQKPIRIQGCFVSDKEVEEVVSYIKAQDAADYSDDILEEIEKQAASEKIDAYGSGSDKYDSLLPQAAEVVIDSGQASTSFLQRRLKVGYARAARIMDEMEERGIVGPQDGSKAREIRMTKQQWLEMSLNQLSKQEGEQSYE